MLRLYTLTLLLFFLACQTTGSEFKSAIQNQECETAAQNLLQGENLLKIGSRAKQVGGVSASTLAMSAAFVGDFVVVVGVGGTIGIVACSPLIAIDVLLQGSGPAISTQCLGSVALTVNPGLTKATSNHMEGMRKYDLTALSQGIRLVAQCFYDRNHEGDREKARKQLKDMLENSELMSATSPAEVENIRRLYDVYFPENAVMPPLVSANAPSQDPIKPDSKLKTIHFSKTTLTFERAGAFCEARDMRLITRQEAKARSTDIVADGSKEYIWAVDSFAQAFQSAWRIETRNGMSSISVDIESQAFAACVGS
jgi:hypothetical protein